MKKIKILVTGAGAPGIQGTLYSLKQNYDYREVEIIGTDTNSNVVGKYLCDKFFVIPKASKFEEYLEAMFGLCKNESVDVIVPQNTAELLTLSKNSDQFNQHGTKVVVSGQASIENSNSKFNLMNLCNELNVPVGEFRLVKTAKELLENAKALGWPNEKVVVKPPVSNGLRGVRIIDENLDLKASFYEEKPNSLFIKMDDLINILGEEFPELIVTEFLPGDEYTVDVFRNNKTIISIPRKRELIRSGITFNATLEQHPEIINYSNLLSEKLDMRYCFGFQFKLDKNNVPKILESNPRVQGTMVLSTFAGANVIYSSVKAALGETVPEFKVDWNTRILRYWGGVGINSKDVIKL